MQVKITKMVYQHPWYVSSAPHYPNGRLGVVFISPTEKVAVGDEIPLFFYWPDAEVVLTGHWQRSISCSRVQWSRQSNASDQDDSSVRSVAEKRDFIPNGYFLNGAYKYNPNQPFSISGAEETYQGCWYTILVISICIMLSVLLGD